MLQTIPRQRPTLPGENLPPAPPVWPGPSPQLPQLPPAGLNAAGRLSPCCRQLATTGCALPLWSVAAV